MPARPMLREPGRKGAGVSAPAYLESAARAVREVLVADHPEYDWTVDVRPEHRLDGMRDSAPW